MLLVISSVKWDNYCLIGCLWDIIESRWLNGYRHGTIPWYFNLQIPSFTKNKMIHFDKCFFKKGPLIKTVENGFPLIEFRTLFLSLLFLSSGHCDSLKHLSQGGPLPPAHGNRFFSHLLETEILYSMWAVSPHSTTALWIKIIKTTRRCKIKSKFSRTRESIGSPRHFSWVQTIPVVLMVSDFFWGDIYPKGFGQWNMAGICWLLQS